MIAAENRHEAEDERLRAAEAAVSGRLSVIEQVERAEAAGSQHVKGTRMASGCLPPPRAAVFHPTAKRRRLKLAAPRARFLSPSPTISQSR
jgi:hypothetical protein